MSLKKYLEGKIRFKEDRKVKPSELVFKNKNGDTIHLKLKSPTRPYSNKAKIA